MIMHAGVLDEPCAAHAVAVLQQGNRQDGAGAGQAHDRGADQACTPPGLACKSLSS